MKKLIFSLLNTFLVVLLFAQDPAQKMDELVSAYVANQKFNGSVLVAKEGKVLLQKGYGFRDAANKEMHDHESIFQVGSITKQITAALIMQLVQEKKLSLSDTLGKFFKGFVNGNKITIEHLLTHQSGLYNYTDDTVLLKSDVTQPYSRDYMVGIFKAYPPDFEPGAKFNYSNSGYSMLGYIAEKVTGRPYETLVRQRIFHPLGMYNSGFDFTHLDNAKKAKGYFYLSTDSVALSPIVDSTISYAGGSVYSTVGDLLIWERAIASGKLLKTESWKKIFTPQKNKYGYGWAIDSMFKRMVHAHSGGIHGFSSFILRVPAEELVIIVLDNSSGRAPAAIARSLAAIALNASYKIPEVVKETRLPSSTLKKYTGEYQLAPGFSIKVFMEGEQLKAQATNQQAFELYAEKEDHFFLKVVEAKIEFVKNEEGEITEMILHQGGRSPRGKRIK